MIQRSATANRLPEARREIVYRPIDDLKPDPKNPCKHSKKQIRQLARSIKEFGFSSPVLLDRDSTVIAGHARLLGCREAGPSEVPTICLDHLDEARIRAFLIADNKLTENATWDDRLLTEHFRNLSLIDRGSRLPASGVR